LTQTFDDSCVDFELSCPFHGLEIVILEIPNLEAVPDQNFLVQKKSTLQPSISILPQAEISEYPLT